MIRQKMIQLNDEQLFASFKGNPPASPALIAQSQAKLSFQLPADYVQFLQQMNGGEGSLGENAYVALSRVEQLGEMNADCEVAEFARELLLFGSNGAGEAFAYDHSLLSASDHCHTVYHLGLMRRCCDSGEFQTIPGGALHFRDTRFEG